MTKNHPFDQTIYDLFLKLKAALKQKQEAEIQITTNSAAIRALANTCEDEEVRDDYLTQLEEMSAKQGFKEVVLTALGKSQAAMTPREIKNWILLTKKMDLSAYSNPLASIHTTLRRMEGIEVEQVLNSKEEKAYRMRGGFKRGDIAKAFAAEARRKAFYGE